MKIKRPKLVAMILTGVIVMTLVVGIVVFINKKHDNSISNDNVVASELGKIGVLSEDNEAEAAEMVKKNTVKIVNTIGDKEVVGTGFFDESGFLITNSHVVDIHGTIHIEYYDGSLATAKLISNDIESDIALLYVENAKANALVFGNTSKLKVTNTVLGIGYAYNLKGESTVTKGVIPDSICKRK